VGGGSQKKLALFIVSGAIWATVFLDSGTVANGDAGAVQWLPPTPPSGSSIVATAGLKLTLRLAASSADPGNLVQISPATRLPREAKLSSLPGNPARAVLTWTPQGRQIGDHALRFTAFDNSPSRLTAQTITVPVRVKPGTVILTGVGNVSRWAFVVRHTLVRSAPRVSAHAKARLSRSTPENYPNPVMVLRERVDRNGVWLQIRLPILPNNSTGWVRRTALGSLKVTSDHLIVYRAATKATLFRNGTPIFSTRVGVGKPFWPTPRGEFFVTEKMSGFHNAAYGPVAFGTSARSPVLTDWPGGGFIGIHGTDAPRLIPGHISHGCIRLRNAAILHLARIMGVGTPLSVR
jgi:lipoprotein-anchoring transpeptidase ErfK/SrfK